MVDQRQKRQGVPGSQCDECDTGGVRRSWQEEEVEEASFEGVGRKELVIKLVGFVMKVEVKGMFEED